MIGHCRHCDPDCAGETIDDPDESIYHFAPDEAFIWSSDYGCPVYRSAELLREMADTTKIASSWLALRRAAKRIEKQGVN